MKTVGTNLKYQNLGTTPFAIETSKEHIKLHCVLLAVAKRGSGKSYFISNLLKWLDFDRIIIVSPTFESNIAQFKHLNIDPKDVLDPDDPNTAQILIDIADDEAYDLQEYRRKLQIFKELKSIYKQPNRVVDESLGLFHEFVDPFTNKWIPPSHIYNGRRPKIGVFVDDAQSTQIFRNKRFLNLVTRHRHLGSMPDDEPSIGMSLFIAVQNYTAQGGGLPKAIRGNCTHLALWKTKSDKELKQISDELSGEVSATKFIEIYDYAMNNGEPYPMLFVDLHPKKEHPSQFRQNYYKFIIPNEI